MAVLGLSPTRAGRVPAKNNGGLTVFPREVGMRVVLRWKGGHGGGSFCWTFLLKKKKETTLSYSPWIFSRESQHHCGGPKTILLLHPSGSLQISKIR